MTIVIIKSDKIKDYSDFIAWTGGKGGGVRESWAAKNAYRKISCLRQQKQQWNVVHRRRQIDRFNITDSCPNFGC